MSSQLAPCFPEASCPFTGPQAAEGLLAFFNNLVLPQGQVKILSKNYLCFVDLLVTLSNFTNVFWMSM